MATIKEDDTYVQTVRFDVEPEKQHALITAITREVERWVSSRPGFVSSTFHASHDGRHVLNYAQWQDEAAFRCYLEDPMRAQLYAAISAVDSSVKPVTVQYRVVKSIDAKS